MHKLARYEVDKRKQKLIDHLEDDKLFEQILDTFKPRELVEIQVILWNYVIDYSYVVGKNFSRSNLTGRMEPTSNYQYRVGCNERIDYCSKRARCVCNELVYIAFDQSGCAVDSGYGKDTGCERAPETTHAMDCPGIEALIKTFPDTPEHDSVAEDSADRTEQSGLGTEQP